MVWTPPPPPFSSSLFRAKRGFEKRRVGQRRPSPKSKRSEPKKSQKTHATFFGVFFASYSLISLHLKSPTLSFLLIFSENQPAMSIKWASKITFQARLVLLSQALGYSRPALSSADVIILSPMDNLCVQFGPQIHPSGYSRNPLVVCSSRIGELQEERERDRETEREWRQWRGNSSVV